MNIGDIVRTFNTTPYTMNRKICKCENISFENL